MDDEEGMWGKPSKFFICDKPIDLKPIDGHEFSCEVEPTSLDVLEAQEQREDVFHFGDFMAGKPVTLNFTIDAKSARGLRKLLRIPRLPRRLKKYVKKNCFEGDVPKRISPQVLRLAFALNFPNKAHKVGYHIGVDLAKGEENETNKV